MTDYSDTPKDSEVTYSRIVNPSSEFVVLVSDIIQGLWRNLEVGQVRVSVTKNERQSFQTYIYRVMRRAKLSYAAVIIALKYINLLSKRRDEMPSLKIRTAECMATEEARIVVVSFILANKHFYDHAYRNKTWAKMTGIDKNVLYHCEKEALAALDYDLTITPTQYSEWLKTLQEAADIVYKDMEHLESLISKKYEEVLRKNGGGAAKFQDGKYILPKSKFESATLPRNFEPKV